MRMLLLHGEEVTEEMLDSLEGSSSQTQEIRECSACSNKSWIVFPDSSQIECACCGTREEFDPE